MSVLPWEINPNLDKDKIIELAKLIVDVRGEVIDLHDEALGDTRLSLGMRAYECCRSRIIAESKIETWDWLGILTPTGRFTFLIDGVPVRFVRNDPNQLPSEKLIPSEETLMQMDMFASESRYATTRWFFVIDTFYKTAADNIYFVGYNDIGDIISQWDIPLEKHATPLVIIDNNFPAKKEIPKAPISIKTIEKKALPNEA